MEDSSVKFGKWRSFFWPIYRYELKKFVPLFLMFALITFNYNLLRAYKDSMVVTANHSGAEAIPFIKVWAILPAAVLLTFIFTRLSNRYSREKVFYIMMSIFLIFFFLFAFILFPAQDYLHPNAFADRLQTLLPPGCKGLIALVRNWTFTLFYVMSELWSTAILSVLFWGFANEVTSVKEAKRHYGMLTIGGNIAGIFAGQAAIFFSGNLYLDWLPYGKNAWDQSVLFLSCTIILSGFLTLALFYWLNHHTSTPSLKSDTVPEMLPQPKIKMSMRKNFAYLAQSKYLACIAAIVIAYNLAINLVEIVWKNQIKQAYPNPNEYNIYMGEVMTLMGIIATIIAVFVTNSVIRKSWTATALIPAVITLVTGLSFFIFTLFQHSGVSWIGSVLGTTPLMLSIAFGAIQNSMSRACKYTLFDATKEMAFIPLDSESKLKGKAAIDGVGSRIGKSGGSVIHQGLLIIFSTVGASTPYVAAIFFGIIIIWIGAVVVLGKQFDFLTTRKRKAELEAAKPSPILINKGT